MVNPHHVAHWYPTAAYLYVFWLDALALGLPDSARVAADILAAA